MLASFWMKFTYLCLRQVYGVFSRIYSRHLTILRSCYCKKQIDVSFLCVCPLIDNELRHNIVKVYCGTTRLRLVVPQLLTMLWRNLSSIRGQMHKKKTDVNLLMWRFSEDFRPLSEYFRRFSKTCPKVTRTLPNIFRKLPKISQDCWRLSKTFEEDPNMFRSYTNEFKYNFKRDKLCQWNHQYLH